MEVIFGSRTFIPSSFCSLEGVCVFTCRLILRPGSRYTWFFEVGGTGSPRIFVILMLPRLDGHLGWDGLGSVGKQEETRNRGSEMAELRGNHSLNSNAT